MKALPGRCRTMQGRHSPTCAWRAEEWINAGRGEVYVPIDRVVEAQLAFFHAFCEQGREEDFRDRTYFVRPRFGCDGHPLVAIASDSVDTLFVRRDGERHMRLVLAVLSDSGFIDTHEGDTCLSLAFLVGSPGNRGPKRFYHRGFAITLSMHVSCLPASKVERTSAR